MISKLMLEIPALGKDMTEIIAIGGSSVLHHTHAEKAAPKKASTVVKVKTKKIPVSVPRVKVKDTWAPQASRTASGSQIKGWIEVVATLTLIIAGGILGYQRFAKGIDVFKPMRNKIALAYYAVTGGNYTLVDKNELNDLVAEAEKPGVLLVTQEVYIVQADGSVTTNDSGALASKDKPKADTTPAIQYDWKGTNAIAEGEEEEAQDKIASVKKPHKSESSVTVVGTVVEAESNSLAGVQGGSEVGQKQAANTSDVTVASIRSREQTRKMINWMFC